MSGFVTMAHGSGGRASMELFETVFRRHFGDPLLGRADDAADLDLEGGKYCYTTDSFVVQPVFFPGGDIGKLAVCGTVNDLSVNGAKPLFLTCGFIIEEGFPVESLDRIAASMAEWAGVAGIRIVAGDTKVVSHGQADGVYINTSGLGIRTGAGARLGVERVSEGDKVIVTGTLGEHGVAVMSLRKGLEFHHGIKSDCFPLNRCLSATVEALGGGVKFMRDATRGGAATVLNEISRSSGRGVIVEEAGLPVTKAVEAACGFLGLDPMYIANEGKAVVVVSPETAEKALAVLRGFPESASAAVIGEVNARAEGLVLLRTRYGSERILSMLSGEPLPRIC